MVPGPGVESEQEPPRTDDVAPVSAVITPSDNSGMPLSRSTFRMSSGIPRVVANVFREAAFVSARGPNLVTVPMRCSGL